MTNAAGEGFNTPAILDDCHGSRLHFPEVASREIIELSLNPDELNEDNDMILFQPGSGIKQTSYTTYAFARGEFETKIGRLPLKKMRKIKAEVIETEAKNYDPVDQMVQKPIGGFDLTRHLCSIISVEK